MILTYLRLLCLLIYIKYQVAINIVPTVCFLKANYE